MWANCSPSRPLPPATSPGRSPRTRNCPRTAAPPPPPPPPPSKWISLTGVNAAAYHSLAAPRSRPPPPPAPFAPRGGLRGLGQGVGGGYLVASWICCLVCFRGQISSVQSRIGKSSSTLLNTLAGFHGQSSCEPWCTSITCTQVISFNVSFLDDVKIT